MIEHDCHKIAPGELKGVRSGRSASGGGGKETKFTLPIASGGDAT
jgi:hypothetical protein